jgi:hypothetical protein
MEDLKAKLEKLRTEAEDCELIGRLATDIHKRAAKDRGTQPDHASVADDDSAHA